MKVLACSSLVLAVLLVTAAEGTEGFLWATILTDMTSEVCSGDNAQLCIANAGRCFGDLLTDPFKVETEDDLAVAKRRVIECGVRLSVGVDFSPLSLECFGKYPMTGFGTDLVGLFIYYEVPTNQVPGMVKCVGAEVFNTLKECLTSTDTNQP